MTTISIAVAEVLGRWDDKLQLTSCEWLFRYRLVHAVLPLLDGFSKFLGTPRGWSGWSGGRAGSKERRLPPLECLGLEARRSEARQSEIRTGEQKWGTSVQSRDISSMQRQQTID